MIAEVSNPAVTGSTVILSSLKAVKASERIYKTQRILRPNVRVGTGKDFICNVKIAFLA